mgnify:CR=1 FL=1
MTGAVSPPLPEPVRAEPVGSLLRPGYLLEARRRRERGEMDAPAFKRVEDRAVREAVRVQEETGLPVVTDGEMRRLSFQSQMTAAVDGFGDPGLEAFTWGRWRGDGETGDRTTARPREMGLTGKLRRRRSLSGEEFVYLRSRTQRLPKATLPSPGLFANFWSPDDGGPYPDLADFLDDAAGVLEAEARRLAELGCRYVQIDAPHYPLLVEEETRAFYQSPGWGRERWIRESVSLENRVMEAAPDVTFALHMCRGNQASRWLARGGYGPLTPVFRRTRARRLLLEYDDERSGGFGPLEAVPEDRVVVLGLVTTKRGEPEDPGRLEQRVMEAEETVPRGRLAVSTQCGFGTSVLGNRLTAEEQRRKLSAVVRLARHIWGGAGGTDL